MNTLPPDDLAAIPSPSDHAADERSNPFDPRQPFAPFSGREVAFARIHQHITEPRGAHALVIVGEPRMGKTALLRNFSAVFDAAQFIPVYLALKTPPTSDSLRDETLWLRMLYQAMFDALVAAGYSEERLPTLPLRHDNWRAWLKDIALPKVAQVLRVRRLILLFDDGDALLDAKRLPTDTAVYLQSLLLFHANLALVMTVSSTNEGRLEKLRPLISPSDALDEAYRLGMLSADELKRLYAGPDDALVSEVAQAVYQATGGHPALVQRFGYTLWERTHSRVFTIEDVQAVTSLVYTDSQPLYAQMWTTLTLNEKLVLTALIGLIYADPLQPVSAAEIEKWLVDTDYHLDLTAIYAALRALEYRQLVTNFSGKVTITSSLLQKWLLENARLETLPRSEGVLGVLTSPRQHPALWIALLVASALLIVVLLALTSNSSPAASGTTIPPTVTLVGD